MKSFVNAWNGVAAQYGSLDYDGIPRGAKTAMAAAGTALPADLELV